MFKKFVALTALIITVSDVAAEKCERDIIFEFKAAYFRPLDCVFKNIYQGGALFGPEVTFKIFRNIYGFASIDYLTKNGHSIGLCSPTQVNMLPLGIGLKFMGRVSEHAQLYAGLGFQPTYLRTKDCSPYVIPTHKKWGFGGIAKFGSYIDLGCNVVLDLFVDYSFVKVKPSCCNNTYLGYIQPRKADLSGFIFGGGLGYRFN